METDASSMDCREDTINIKDLVIVNGSEQMVTLMW